MHVALIGALGSVYGLEMDGRLRYGTIKDKSEAKGVVSVAEKEGSCSDCDVAVPTLTFPTFCAVEHS